MDYTAPYVLEGVWLERELDAVRFGSSANGLDQVIPQEAAAIGELEWSII